MEVAEFSTTGPWSDECFELARHCLFCGSEVSGRPVTIASDWFFGVVRNDFAFLRCTTCSSLLLRERPTPACLPLAYATYYTHNHSGPDDKFFADDSPSASLRLKQAYVRRRYGGLDGLADRIGHFVYPLLARGRVETDAYYRFVPPPPARVLDYGCGGGEFLRRLRALGHDVTGVDFDRTSLAEVEASGIKAYTPDKIPEAGWQSSFDAITLGHVIEHVTDPRALLTQLLGWLRPGGLLYIETPNAEAEGLEVFGRYWRGLEAPRHLALPSANALLALLEDIGFRRAERFLRRSVRSWTWADSMAAAPEQERAALAARQATAAPETLANAEFIGVLCRKDL